MDYPQISSSDELTALLASIDGKLANLDSLNRSRTVALVSSMSRALSHFRSSGFLADSPAVSPPIVLQIVVSDSGTLIGGAQGAELETAVDSRIPDVSFCEKGVGDSVVLLSSRSVSCQVTTTRPSPSTPRASSAHAQAPPVRREVHCIHAPPTVSPPYMGSGAVRTFEEFDSGEEEDESEYPVGYFDDSEDDLDGRKRSIVATWPRRIFTLDWNRKSWAQVLRGYRPMAEF